MLLIFYMKKNRLIIATIIAAVIFLLSPKEAIVTQIFLEDVTLKELINISSYIIIAKKTLPFQNVENIDITPAGKNKDKELYPEFIKVTYNFEVIKMIYEKGNDHKKGSITIGNTIKVSPAEQDFNFEMHKKYYIDGVRKSWAERNYSPSANFVESEELILFLTFKDHNNYALTVNDSYETLGREKEILEILKSESQVERP